MICPQCQQSNPETNTFCGKCGALLLGERRRNVIPITDTAGEMHQLAETTLQSVKKEAHYIEISTLDEIHEKAIKWAKVQLFFLGSAVSILLMALFIWGYKQFSDFERLILDSQNEITALSGQLSENATQVSQDSTRVSEQADTFGQTIQQEFERLKQLSQQINEIDNTIHTEIKKLRSELLTSLQEARNLQEQAKSDRYAIEKIQNSFYEIFFQIDGDHPLDDARQAALFALLTQNGFLVKDRNIVSHVSVDRLEVIYYNAEAGERAQLLTNLLRKIFPGMTLRHLDHKDRDAREILVKLRNESSGN